MFRHQRLNQPSAADPEEGSAAKTRVFKWWNSRLQGYGPAVGSFVIAITLHGLIRVLFGPNALGSLSFFLYLLSFLTAAWCGYGPGLLVTILITCGMPYLFKPNFSIRNVDVGGVAIFLLLSMIVSGTASGRRRTEQLLRSMNEELDKRVGEQTTTLRHRIAELETLYAKLSVGLCFLDTDLRFIRVNEKLASINGVSIEAHLGRQLRDVISKELAAIVEPLYRRVLETEETMLDLEVPGPSTGTGAGRFWAISCSPVITDGRSLGVQVVVQDITERKEAERALNQANSSLRRANEDLEQFAFSASHDLQEPLRTVAIYSQLLKKRFDGALGPEGNEYIRYTVQGALRMQQLIRDLLAYTEAAMRNAEPAPPASAREALEQAISNLEAAMSETPVSITHSELPSIPVRTTHLVQLFQNLISNSIKYRSQEPLRIDVSATPHEGDRWLFRVRDNGIGIDPQYHQQVFTVFKRLHHYEEYAGTGIGLAICRKIVEQHGGQIWVDSMPGEGATFSFILPSEQRHAQVISR